MPAASHLVWGTRRAVGNGSNRRCTLALCLALYATIICVRRSSRISSLVTSVMSDRIAVKMRQPSSGKRGNDNHHVAAASQPVKKAEESRAAQRKRIKAAADAARDECKTNR